MMNIWWTLICVCDRWTIMRPCCGSGQPGSRPSTVCWTASGRRWGSPKKPSPPSRACSRCSPKSWTSLQRRETTSVKQTRRKVVMEEKSKKIDNEKFVERVWIRNIWLLDIFIYIYFMCIVFLFQEELSRVICPATFESIYFFSSWNTWRNSCTMLMKAARCPCLCLQRYTRFNQHAVETNSFHSIFMTKFSLLFGQSFLQARIYMCSEMNRSFKPNHFL